MKPWIALILMAVILVNGHAETVKVIGWSKSGPGYGSGWLVGTPLGTMVVTSQHPFSAGSSFEIFLEGGSAAYSAKLVWTDWSKGLSLLKTEVPPNLISEDLYSAQYSERSGLREGDEVVVRGFPLRQTGQSLQAPGIVATVRSARAFVSLAEGFELVNSHGEYGMSGGPVYDKSRGQILGILSHQVLTVVPGQESEVTPLIGDSPARHLFVISAKEVFESLSEYSKSGAGRFVQISDRDEPLRLRFGGFVLTFHAGPAVKTASANIGGDGAGVGGAATEDETRGTVEVLLDQTQTEATASVPPHLSIFLGSWRTNLTRRRPVSVKGFVKKETGKYLRVNFRTMEEFVKFLMRPELVPYGSTGDSGSRVQAAAHDLGVALTREGLSRLRNRRLLAHLKSLSDLLSEDYGASVTTSSEIRETANVKGPFQNEWADLFADPELLDAGIEILRAMSRLQELL